MARLDRRLSTCLLVLSLTAVFLAGCIGGEDVETPQQETNAPDQSDEATVSETTGAIEGTARNLDFAPLAGARITLLTAARELTGKETIVARDGTFVINDIEPAQYFVHISALGYESAQRPAVVAAGKITKVEFALNELKVEGPWVYEEDWVGKVSLALSWQVEPPVVGCVIQQVHTQTVKTCGGIRFQSQGDNGEVAVKSADTAKTFMIALVWDPAGPLGENLQFDFMCMDVPRDGSGGAVLDPEHPCYFLHEKTTSPVEHRVDEEHWLEHAYNYTAEWRARVFATYGLLGTYDLTGIDVGVAYEQAFTIHAAVFHEEPAPVGYTVIPDA